MLSSGSEKQILHEWETSWLQKPSGSVELLVMQWKLTSFERKKHDYAFEKDNWLHKFAFCMHMYSCVHVFAPLCVSACVLETCKAPGIQQRNAAVSWKVVIS